MNGAERSLSSTYVKEASILLIGIYMNAILGTLTGFIYVNAVLGTLTGFTYVNAVT